MLIFFLLGTSKNLLSVNFGFSTATPKGLTSKLTKVTEHQDSSPNQKINKKYCIRTQSQSHSFMYSVK